MVIGWLKKASAWVFCRYFLPRCIDCKGRLNTRYTLLSVRPQERYYLCRKCTDDALARLEADCLEEIEEYRSEKVVSPLDDLNRGRLLE